MDVIGSITYWIILKLLCVGRHLYFIVPLYATNHVPPMVGHCICPAYFSDP